MPAAETLRLVRDQTRARTLLRPLRLRLLRELRSPQSAASLSRRLGVPRQKLNYHLRELERAGFVELVEERRRGNCTERVLRATARAYVIDPAALGELGEDADAFRDRFSVSYLIALAARTIRELAELRARAESAGKRLATLSLQADVRFRSADDRAAFAEELTAAVSRIVARYDAPGASGARAFRVVLGAYPPPAKHGTPSAGQASSDVPFDS